MLDNKAFRSFLLLLLVIGTFSILATAPIIEGDVFWHIKTGELIWQDRALPSTDNFTYTSQQDDPMRPRAVRYEVIMKGYWLSQLVFALIWSLAGQAGLVLFRAAFMAAILLLLYLWMRREGREFYLSLVFLILAGFYLRELVDRPQNFSFIFFILTAMAVESLRTRPGADSNDALNKRLLSAGLPLLMLIWANMHGGYVMGAVLIGVYAFAEVLQIIFRRVRGMRPSVLAGQGRFLLVCTVSIGATLLNPITWKAYLAVYQTFGAGLGTVTEMKSPLESALQYGDYSATFWVLFLMAGVAIILRPRYIPLHGMIALAVFGGASLLAVRNIPFFLCLTPLMAGAWENLTAARLKKATRLAALGLTLFIVIYAFVEADRGSVLQFRFAERVYPQKAVAFLKEMMPQGNLFSTAEWGSYMILALPEKKVFTDGRRLMDDIEVATNSILIAYEKKLGGLPHWKALLNAYRVDVIMVPSVSPFNGEYYALTEALYRDGDFSLVYQDETALVYLRKGRQNDSLIEANSLPKGLSLVQAIQRLHEVRSPYQREMNLRKIAELYTLMGKPDAAKQYYDMLGK